MTTINWTKIYASYKGKWVALDSNETTVLGSGKSAAEAFTKAKKRGYENPILTKVPKKMQTYVGQ